MSKNNNQVNSNNLTVNSGEDKEVKNVTPVENTESKVEPKVEAKSETVKADDTKTVVTPATAPAVEPKVETKKEEVKVDTKAGDNQGQVKDDDSKEVATTASDVCVKVGATVKIKDSVKKTVTGQDIPAFAYKNTYKVSKILPRRLVLVAGVYSIAVTEKDVVLV